MRNNIIHLRNIAMVFVGILFIGGIAHAESIAELRQKMRQAQEAVGAQKERHKIATDRLNEMIGHFVIQHATLANVSIDSTPATDTGGMVEKIKEILDKLRGADRLTAAMEAQLAAIETQRETCNNIWADVLLAQIAYEYAVDAFNAEVSPEEAVTTIQVPQHPHVYSLYLCVGPCSVDFETRVLATTSHLKTCPSSDGCGRDYYDCPNQPDKSHTVLTCQNLGLKWNPDTTSYDTVTCNTSYRNCQNTGGNCFNGQVGDRGGKHRDDVSASNSQAIVISEVPNGTLPPICPWCNKPAVTSTPGPYSDLPHFITCSTCNSMYFSCDEESIERHQTRTCWRCGAAYTGCTRTTNLCPGEGVHIDEAPPLRCSNPYGGSGTCIYGHVVASNADEHKTTCSTHGDYWLCNQGHNDRHRSRTCTRCSQSYQNCGNYSSACQDVYWHTERTITTDSDSEGNDDNGYIIGDCDHTFTRSQWYRHQSHTCRETNSQGQRCIAGRKFTCLPHTHAYRSTTTTNDPYVTGECDHTYRQSQASNHEWVETCPQTNNGGQQCSGGNYYECRPHAHTYGSTSTSPVNNDNGDDTENVPSAPSAPTPPSVSYEPCGIHTAGTTGSHAWVACPTNSSGQNCSSGGYYACQSHRHSYPTTTTHEPCGIHTTGTTGSHAWVACPTNSSGQNCSSGGYYACQSHRHSYPTTTTYERCGRHITGTTGSHVWVACPTNSSGQNCSSGGYYACQSHRHSYPTTTTYERCGRHITGTTGSHVWVACPTNSSGQNCSSGGYYACQSHRHSYPTTTHEPCGRHTTGTSGSHSWVTCPTNSSGQNCSSGGYYACQSHRHSYPTTTTYEPCGRHTTGTTGSHSWVTCPTNSSGQNCSSGGYYACQSHRHSYPTTTVVCPANSWTGCRGTVSHATTCAAGHTYYSCNASAAASHSQHTVPTRPCGHLQSSSGNHGTVSCPTNSSGQNCSSGYSYACQSHTHSYPSSETNSSENTSTVPTIYCSGCWQVVNSASEHEDDMWSGSYVLRL